MFIYNIKTFSLFINDLATNLNEAGLGVDLTEDNVSILLFADDIVLLAPNELKLHKQLDIINTWCTKWKLYVNIYSCLSFYGILVQFNIEL